MVIYLSVVLAMLHREHLKNRCFVTQFHHPASRIEPELEKVCVLVGERPVA